MLIPMMPYFVTHFGASAFVVGLLFATFSLCQFLSAPLWGIISDRLGRKTVLIVSQIGATIGWAMLGLAPDIAVALSLAPIAVVFAARILEGISGGNISITQAYVADLVEAKDRARAFGLIGAMFAGDGLRPRGRRPALCALRLRGTVPRCGRPAVSHAPPNDRDAPGIRARPDEEDRLSVQSLVECFGQPRLARVLWQKLAIALALYGWFGVFALYLQRQVGFSLAKTDYFFSVFAVFNVFMNVVMVRRVSAQLGDRRMSNLGLAALVAGFALVPFVHELVLLSATMLLFSLGMALTNTGITALISNTASDREQGMVLGASSSLDSLSGILAPPVSTGLLSGYGPRVAGVESLVMASVAFVLGIRAGMVPETETVKAADA